MVNDDFSTSIKPGRALWINFKHRCDSSGFSASYALRKFMDDVVSGKSEVIKEYFDGISPKKNL